ncbi:hypothetical protein HPB51_023413 [Rhipicephalus microplus]|uniref:CCHC-type domain-containing protein n=1 Tax=Rhipicephalus microplus TaxID=6941 RepID=A0A9J6DXM4_RHIMP|nr:hypothetical protein HPB51_023413 [Rhipicephalus microplus]
MAARLPPSATEEDIVCSYLAQNIFVVSTPQETNALAYSTVQEIILTKQRHPVATYLTPPGHSCHRVIRGVDIDFTDADLQRMLRTPPNPTVLDTRRINNTTTVVILFNDLKVPNYVYCGLCKRQMDTCRNCGRVGHHHDVCPHPTDKVCDQLGHGLPGPDHVCSALKCALCGGTHVTGDRACRSRYQVSYLVRRRRQQLRCRNKSRSSRMPAASFLPSAYKGSSTTRPSHTGQLTGLRNHQVYLGRQGHRYTGNSVTRDTTPDLALVRNIRNSTWINTQVNLGSDHYICSITIAASSPPPRKFKVVDWDHFRTLRKQDHNTYTSVRDLFARLQEDVTRATKEIETTRDVERLDSRLAHLIEAQQTLQAKWKTQKLNRRLRKKIAEPNKQIEEQSGTLARQQWDEVCYSVDAQMSKGSE